MEISKNKDGFKKINIQEITEGLEGGISIEFHREGGGAEWTQGFERQETHITVEPQEILRWQPYFLRYLNDPSISFNESLVGYMRLLRTEERVSVEGRVATSMVIGCGRCLEHFVQPLDIPFSFTISRKGIVDKEIELMTDDLEVQLIMGDIIDIMDIAGEQIALNLPIKPLCKEDCLGLCNRCGKNLNHEPCSCSNQKVNQKFAKLKDFQIKKLLKN